MAIGIIGGSGVYDPKILKDSSELKIKTPYGPTSDVIVSGVIGQKKVHILPRHGSNHLYNPSNIPYRANIWAFKQLGITRILSVSAVGSLKEDYIPGDIVLTDQFIDRTTKRHQTFYENVHLGIAEPFCNELRKILSKSAAELNIRFHGKGTCVVIEGPRFSTKAESNLFRSWGADIINMTLVPEAVLAREAEICYANIAMVTDYDVWKEHTVSHAEVLKTMEKNLEKVRNLIMKAIPYIADKSCAVCGQALKDASM